MYSRPIQQLITAFTRLPSVGTRTAERYVFYLLKSGKREVGDLHHALDYLMSSIKSCRICWDFSDASPCRICADRQRDQITICVVADFQDVQAIEKTGEYHGVYHILRGLIDPDDDTSITALKIGELLERSKNAAVKEIILALNPDLPGETTMMWLERALAAARPGLTVTRLAKGLPMGSDLQYADEITLGSAVKHRRKL